jgi:hypothetical protein
MLCTEEPLISGKYLLFSGCYDVGYFIISRRYEESAFQFSTEFAESSFLSSVHQTCS